MPVTFIFVHGGFGSPAELAPTVPHLEARGHSVINVDLPSENPEATLDDYADAVIRAIAGTTGRRILVAHSAGGATIPLVASRIPVDRMVFAATPLHRGPNRPAGPPACIRGDSPRRPDRDCLGAFGLRHATRGTFRHPRVPRRLTGRAKKALW